MSRLLERFEISPAWSGFDVQGEADLFPDEIVRHPCIFDPEIRAVDAESGSDIDGVIRHLDFGWKGNGFCGSVQRQVAGDGEVGALLLDGGRDERRGRELRDGKKVGRL